MTKIIHYGSGADNHLCWVFSLENDFTTCMMNGEETTTPFTPATVTETEGDGGSAGCPSCCSGLEHSVEWVTTQGDPLSTVTARGSEVLMAFADDKVCGGIASLIQNMTATATVTLAEATTFDLLWSAVAEDQYETLTITVNGEIKT